MMENYHSLIAFFCAYESPGKNITIDDIDRLKSKLKAEGHAVRELKKGSVIVCQPNELEASARKRKAAQQREAQKYTKLEAAIPKQIAKEFADACRILGVSQVQILLPIIHDAIHLSQQSSSSSNK